MIVLYTNITGFINHAQIINNINLNFILWSRYCASKFGIAGQGK